MDQKIPDSTIAHAKADIVAVIQKYVQLEKKGTEFVACCPFHEEKTPSFSVEPAKKFFYCFGCGAAGDAVDFVMNYEDLSFREAVEKIVGKHAIGGPIEGKKPSRPKEQAPQWRHIFPVPAGLKQQSMNVFRRQVKGEWQSMAASARWAYRDAAGAVIGLVYRFELPGGGKDLIPQCYCEEVGTGKRRWRWMAFQEPRPMYGLEKLAKFPNAQVLVVEGEKACDAGQKRFISDGVPVEKLITVSWPGGGKAVGRVDWSPLHGRNVGFWPDADLKHYVDQHAKSGQLMPFLEQPGTLAMLAIYDAIKDQCGTAKFIIPPDGVADGWDLADEFPEGFKLLAHVKSAAVPAEEVRSRFAIIESIVENTQAKLDQDEQPPAPEPTPVQDEDDTPPWDGPPGQFDVPPSMPAAGTEEFDEDLIKNGYFTILGYDGPTYYLFQHEKRQVMTISKGDMSDIGLIEIAPANWWEEHFPGKNGVDRKAAANWLFRTANSRGIYDPSRVRGRGAWMDKGRAVFHHGDYLTVDGVSCDITKINSSYVYPMAKRMPEPSETPLTDAEGRHLLKVAKMVRWTMPASSALIVGWTFLSPVGGALKWRPHIWITGAAGSGKSSIQRDFCAALTSGISTYAQGNSTEAGIRQDLRADAVPVCIDELESNDEKERQRVESVLSLVRQSSSESQAKVLKGTMSGNAMNFHIRSMFCLASINTKLDKKADIDRITRLAIRPPALSGSDEDQWVLLEEELHKICTDETISQRMLARALAMLPTIQANVKLFVKVAAKHFGTQRDGDQFGTLMAGTWSLCYSRPATEEDAMRLIDAYNWHEHTEDQEQDDSVMALSSILSAKIRMPANIGDVTVYELIRETSQLHREGLIDSLQAESTLKRNGIAISHEEGVLLFGITSPNLKKLVRETAFATDLRGQLLRVPGAARYGAVVSMNGHKSRCISVPLHPILGSGYNAAAVETDAAEADEDPFS